MQSFSSSTVSLPAEASTKSKGKILKRLSLKSKKPLTIATGSNPAASQSTTTLVTPTTPSRSRRAFDLFSTTASRKSHDAGATSMPSTPKTPKTPRFRSLAAPSTRSTSASMDAMRNPAARFGDAPPVPAVPKMFLISDEVFVIASPPKEAKQEEQDKSTVAASSRVSSSSSAPSSYSMLSSTSSRTSNSWVDNLGEDETAALPSIEPNRSSLDDIDDQIVLNLCMNLCDEKSPASTLSRSTSLRTAAAPAISHTRMTSAPLSLGPLPPPPSAPSDAVLRKTDQIKKRYSKQSPSIDSWTFPRPAPGTPKLDSISSLKSLEAGLSLDSKLAKRNHKRSSSKQSSTSHSDFSHYGSVKLTPGHVAGTGFFDTLEPQEQLLSSRFSEDSDAGAGAGEDARRLFGILSPVLGSVAKFASNHHTSTPQMSAMDYCRLDGGAATPDMTRFSSSSVSSNSSLSDLSSAEEEPVFDLSQPDLDYRAVYAMAQKYANTTAAKKLPQQPRLGMLPSASKSHKHLMDPVDRSYHLRK